MESNADLFAPPEKKEEKRFRKSIDYKEDTDGIMSDADDSYSPTRDSAKQLKKKPSIKNKVVHVTGNQPLKMQELLTFSAGQLPKRGRGRPPLHRPSIAVAKNSRSSYDEAPNADRLGTLPSNHMGLVQVGLQGIGQDFGFIQALDQIGQHQLGSVVAQNGQGGHEQVVRQDSLIQLLQERIDVLETKNDDLRQENSDIQTISDVIHEVNKSLIAKQEAREATEEALKARIQELETTEKALKARIQELEAKNATATPAPAKLPPLSPPEATQMPGPATEVPGLAAHHHLPGQLQWPLQHHQLPQQQHYDINWTFQQPHAFAPAHHYKN